MVSDLLQNIMRDVKVELMDEFSQNFTRKAFFGKPWVDTKKFNPRGSLMLRTEALKASLISRVVGNALEFESTVPYAQIHNQGGIINRTSSKGTPFEINMPQRQFMGDDPQVQEIIEEAVTENLNHYVNNVIFPSIKIQ